MRGLLNKVVEEETAPAGAVSSSHLPDGDEGADQKEPVMVGAPPELEPRPPKVRRG